MQLFAIQCSFLPQNYTKWLSNMPEDMAEASRPGESTFCDRCRKLAFCKMHWGLNLCWECSGYAGMVEPKK
jgi:hypothetical protein